LGTNAILQSFSDLDDLPWEPDEAPPCCPPPAKAMEPIRTAKIHTDKNRFICNSSSKDNVNLEGVSKPVVSKPPLYYIIKKGHVK
jgi:hypothetical protein